MKRRQLWPSTLFAFAVIVLAMTIAPGSFAQSGNGNGNVNGNAKVDCTIANGKHLKSCTIGQIRQEAREIARQKAGPQKKGVSVKFAGINPATAALSPLSSGATLSSMATTAAIAPLAAAMAPGTTPDYFGVGNYANSPFPAFAAGASLGAVNATVGHGLSAAAFATDGATNVLIANTHAVLPTGTLTSFQVYTQVGSGPNTFHAFVLRPTATANQFTVVFDSGPLSVPVVAVAQVTAFPVTPFQVQAGDIIAHYGAGIPYSGGGSDSLFYPAVLQPVVNQILALDGTSPAYPLFSTNRIYSFSATVSLPNNSTAIGNALSARAFPSDGATNVFVVNKHSALPAGTLTSMQIYTQAGSGPNTFNAYILRPTLGPNPNQYSVVYDSGPLTVPAVAAGQITTFPVVPFQVQAGDLIAHYGVGIPYDGGGLDSLFYPANTRPIASQLVLLDGTDPLYPLFSSNRAYSIDAVIAVPTGTIASGMRKFVDPLPGLCAVSGPTATLGQCIPLATPDTSIAAFAGSDFYRIGLKEFSKKMHSDLPATSLRGYYDMQADPGHANPQYLGPLILATRNRPVRILFQNQLTTDPTVPVDTTYMGAGSITTGDLSIPASLQTGNASKRRAVLHLHGGNTPWISDGTTHQWVSATGDPTALNAPGFAKGFSFQHVPDMVGPLGLTSSLTDGKATFYWTNQQSGRLLWYHDHAYGLTRLDAYMGEAAGYLLVDPAQENALKTATVPGTIVTNPATGQITSADLAHVIPLVIQDKTFVPDTVNQLPAQDPTWDIAAWGGTGSLWFPHVYTPNQNPADISGANGFGRWDWGPWFFPPQNAATLVLADYPCSSIATPAGGWAFPPLMCPGVPDPTRPAPSNSQSGVPEAFMDTPVVNGTAYPKLTVDPTAYRFQVLNGANDRTWNLGLYVADPLTISISAAGSGYAPPPAIPPAVTITGCTSITSATAIVNLDGTVGDIKVVYPAAGPGCTAPVTVNIAAPPASATATQAYAMASANTDVKMVPAVSGASRTTLPNCASTQLLEMDGGGLVNALLDAIGKPLNNTGLPANCWPLYNSPYGFTAGPLGENGVLSWGNSDGRIGGVPDPTTAGPPIIQIGSEGGLLPKATVIPSTPISYDYNKRSVTVLNVLNHGLLLGGAERADFIVDFSAFAGKTLILYNDAPAPVPGADPRLDYFTNDPDYSSSGGAPTTMAGYGPNVRTVMQIVVNSTAVGPLPATPFSLPTLTAAIPNIFTATQDAVIVPETAYPAANGGAAANAYARIQDNSLSVWTGGSLGSLTVTNPGSGYSIAPAVTIAAPSCTINGTTCVQATAAATLPTRAVSTLTLLAGGSGYTSAPTIAFSGGGGSGASALATLAAAGVVKSIAVSNGGSGYTTAPTVTVAVPPCTINGTTCVRATATATVLPNPPRRVTGVTVTNPGNGYTSAPAVTFSGGGGSGATAVATLGKAVASLALTNGGSGYTSAPAVSFTGGGGTGASASTALGTSGIASLTLTNVGAGYTSAPAVTIAAGNPVTATAIANPPVMPLLDKTIQELFTLDYGRMNATLGVELPFTNFLTQTTIPYGYSDPPTEIFKDGETQLWKITHNGVDTHFIHFHLFTVQVVNRTGWDGAIKPPDSNELSFKDTVRMNPLEDVVVALRPFKQTVPFAVPSSWRPMDTTQPVGYQSAITFTNVDPINEPATVTNQIINFGWEYVWHCHILGHEENDMMRAMILAVAPNQPNLTAATGATTGSVTLTITDTATLTSPVPTGFTIYRSTSATGPWSLVGTVSATIAGTNASASFTNSGLTTGTRYYYQVVANNLVGYTQVYTAPTAGYPTASADSAASTVSSATAR